MDLSSWPQIPPINQKNYYTYVDKPLFRIHMAQFILTLVLYSDYLKRDDQFLAFRLQNEENRNRMAKSAKDRDRALAMEKQNDLGMPEPEAEVDGDTNMEDAAEEAPTEAAGSKVIVIHLGSQNLRIGLASGALPKTLPMVIARKATTNESEERDEPKPKRLKLDDGSPMEPEKMFGPEVRDALSLIIDTGSSLLTGSLFSSLRNLRRCVPISRST